MQVSERHWRYIRYALRRANDAPVEQKHRLGCVIVKRNVPISSGYNNMGKTHPRAALACYAYPYLHAELDAMIGVDVDDLHNSVAYVARRRRDHHLALAMPCEYCLAEFRRAGVKEVYYTTDAGEIDCINLRQQRRK